MTKKIDKEEPKVVTIASVLTTNEEVQIKLSDGSFLMGVVAAQSEISESGSLAHLVVQIG